MVPEYYEFYCPTKILCGRKALANLPYELTQLGAARPLLITDRGVLGAGLIKHVEAAFSDSKMEIAARYEDVPVDSNSDMVNELAGLYRTMGCDAIVAVGGGSVIDTAKGVNIVVSEGSDQLTRFQGVGRLERPPRPLVAVPTTAGTGSEVTGAAVIYNQAENVKMAFTSSKLHPHVAIIDPQMTMTMPAKITAATGMDALTHAVEALIGLQANPASDAYAVAAVELIKEHLVPSVADGADVNARLAMANGALLAGIAFSNSMVGIVHALAHATGAICHVPHGVANSIFLPHGMAYIAVRFPESFVRLAGVLGVADPGGDPQTSARAAVAWVQQIQQELHKLCSLPRTLSEADVGEEMLPKIASLAQNEGAVLYSPEEADYDDLLALLKQAF